MQNTAGYLTFDEFVRHWSRYKPDAVAHEHDGRITTYGELDDLTCRMAALFAAEGVTRGDRVAWIGKNADLYYQLFIACGRIGVVMVPVGWRLAPPEMDYILRDTGAKLVFAGDGFETLARKLALDLPGVARVFDTAAARTAIAAQEPTDIAPGGPEDGVLQLYTSGTTGNPKGVVLTNRNLFGLRRAGLDAGQPWSSWDEDEAILLCMPASHIGGTGLAVVALTGAARGIVHAEFDPGKALEAIEQGITRFFIVPAALQMVIQHPKAAATDFSRLKYVMYGAAPIPLELLREAVTTMPNAGFMQCYGMTETTGTIAVLPPDDHELAGNARMRSAGRAVPGVEIRIVDAAGDAVPLGTVGEIVTRSTANMSAYWNLPDATAATLSADGWVRTGDAAYMDADGYVFIQDRVKDMIISGGENVYPAEVESAIYGHPDVAEVAVFGVPDPKWGEAVKAACVPRPGCTIDEDSVIAWARTRIADFKAPKSVDVIAALPRNATGKILRRALRDPYWAGRERQVN